MRRELQNSPIPVPRFQRGAGVYDHTGGTYSHSGMVGFSELHMGKILESMEFQSWKVNFMTKTADPHLTMQWIKEVEMAKSIDELVTSRSVVERTDFTDFDMIDAMIAFALKRAQKYDRFLRARHIAYMIYEHFRATTTCETIKKLSDLFRKRLQNDDVQDCDVRWDQTLLSVSDVP